MYYKQDSQKMEKIWEKSYPNCLKMKDFLPYGKDF